MKIADLNEKKLGIEALLNNELKPKVAHLKQTLAEYRRAIEIQNGMVISEFSKYENGII